MVSQFLTSTPSDPHALEIWSLANGLIISSRLITGIELRTDVIQSPTYLLTTSDLHTSHTKSFIKLLSKMDMSIAMTMDPNKTPTAPINLRLILWWLIISLIMTLIILVLFLPVNDYLYANSNIFLINSINT